MRKSQVLALVGSQPITAGEIADKLGLSVSRVSEVLREQARRGKLVRVQGGSNIYAYLRDQESLDAVGHDACRAHIREHLRAVKAAALAEQAQRVQPASFTAGPSLLKEQSPPVPLIAAKRVTTAPVPAWSAAYQYAELPPDPRWPPFAGRIGRYDEAQA